ncbi:MAG: peptidase, partial [Verrucomicrobia bacterium]|nr:peptidase [Verrucomicrobiota bacterium]
TVLITLEGPIATITLNRPERANAMNRPLVDGLIAALSEAEAKQIIETLVPVAWLGYTIHGDETEGSDAALAVLYHLIAAENPEVTKLLEEVVVIIDPLQNPDGRDRFLKMIAENRGTTPSVDDQSLQHTGYDARGRGNHYFFDLNRDPLFGIHPETRGRMIAVSQWNPVLVVDAHGMGAQDTHLFSPPREPINLHFPASDAQWSRLFARDQAAAFDQHGLVYYHGEWNEGWYPGYTDAWPVFRGAVGILYEQARIAEDGVRRPEGRILSYRESVFHHVIGSMANLKTVQANGKKLLENFYTIRQRACAADGPYAKRTFAVLPTANRARLDKFIKLSQLHGFEMFQATNEFTAASATDQLGREVNDRKLPAGTILIPNRQPLGHLVAAALEFDPRIPAKALEDERQEILRNGGSRIYDTTAWNLTMMFGLEALTLPMELPDASQPYKPADRTESGVVGSVEAPVVFAIDGADDSSVAAAARLMERGLQVRAAEKAFAFDGQKFARGSVVITRLDNRSFTGDWRATVDATARELGLRAVAIRSGLGEGDLPDLGGEHFKRLEPPRIALLSRGGSSPLALGEVWFFLDHELGIRHARINVEGEPDLSRYNVVVVPDRFGGPLPGSWTNRLKDWVRAGGTLIAMGNSAAQFADEKAGLSKVRALPEVLNKLGDYELAVLREWLSRDGDLPPADTVWSYKATPGLKYPWQSIDGAHAEEKELKKRDAWLNLFMPQGAIVAARVDAKHWLTFGCEEPLPVLALRNPVLMAAEGVEVPVRLGYLTKVETNDTASAKSNSAKTESSTKSDSSDKPDPDKKEKKEPPRVGWSALPPGTEMHLRMSGLLWPEATHRLANSAYVTRESLGRGQIILFATRPTFRAATLGPARMMLNAMIYGPGYGAAQPIRP